MSKISAKTRNLIIVLVGVTLRFWYVIANPVLQNNQYDLGSVDASKNIFTGHLGYIYYLFTFRGFPNQDPREIYQFFHPPLHHVTEALWLSFVNNFTKDFLTQLEWLQVPTLIYSCVLLYAFSNLLGELKVDVNKRWIALSVIAFHPTLIYMAGSLNNDGLALLLQFAAVWFAVRWYNNRTVKNIIWIAISIGLGMITKLSASLIAIPVAFLFIYVFITDWKNQKSFPVNRFVQYVIFGAVCVPLGMCWAVRCKLLYDMPLAYVNKLPEDSWQYIGNYSLWERFGIPNPIAFLSNLAHGSIGFGENMWVQMFRTAALGEMDLSGLSMVMKVLSMMLILMCAVVALLAFIAFVQFMLRKNGDACIKWFLIILYFVQVISFMRFCYGYPHQCTLNFRYMVPVLIPQAVAIVKWKDATNA